MEERAAAEGGRDPSRSRRLSGARPELGQRRSRHCFGARRGVFENQFPLVLCGSDGTLIGQRTMHVSGGRWSGQLTYNTSRAQAAAPAVAVKVLARYPQSCLRSVPRPGGVGRVAMLNTGTLTIASPAGGTPTVIPYTTTAMGTYQGGVPLVAWSSDGRWWPNGSATCGHPTARQPGSCSPARRSGLGRGAQRATAHWR